MKMMRASVGVSVATGAALLLAGCGSDSPTAPSAAAGGTSTTAASTTAANTAPTATTTAPTSPSTSSGALTTVPAGPAAPAGPPCTAAGLRASLGKPTPVPGSTGQNLVPLVYTNTSGKTCTLTGFPGLDLRGPADPNGPVYTLRRVPDAKPVTVVLQVGSSAAAPVTVLSPGPGAVGSAGSTRWTPRELASIPPGGEKALTVAWPADLPVLRQDEATRPGSAVGVFAPSGS